jgi:hypothetical protein
MIIEHTLIALALLSTLITLLRTVNINRRLSRVETLTLPGVHYSVRGPK